MFGFILPWSICGSFGSTGILDNHRHLYMNSCGFNMSDGFLSHNCEGYYTILVEKTSKIYDCSINSTEQFTSIVVAFTHNCSSVLLDYHNHQDQEVVLYPYILIPLIIVTLFLALALLAWIILRTRLSVSKEEKITLNRAGLKMVSDGTFRTFSWKELLLVTLFIGGTKSNCMTPMSSHVGPNHSRYEFSLGEGDSACFKEGVLTHSLNVEFSELGLLYNTSEWKEFAWTKRGCGYGLCGTEDECAESGEIGAIHHLSHKSLLYKKLCKPHTTDFFTCVKTWGCWMATHEVMYGSCPRYSVFEVGATTTTDDFEISGLDLCTYEHRNLDPVDHFGMFLVVSLDNSAWLCDKVSETGKPLSGEIGEIQYLHGKDEPLFDFSSFSCELSSSVSSGRCRIKTSSIPNALHNCLQLPGPTSQGFTEWSQGTLRTRGSTARSFTISCPSNHTLVESSHKCHSLKTSLHGVKDVGHLNYLSISADSLNGSGVLTLNSTCGDPSMTVSCDGKPHLFKLIRMNYHECFPDLVNIEDKMTDYETSNYVWKGGNLIEGNLMDHDSLMIILAIMGLLVLALIIKCLFVK